MNPSCVAATLGCALALGCPGDAPPPSVPPAAAPDNAPAVAPVTQAPPADAPHLVAQAVGKAGPIVVEDRAERRVLVIDGVVQGSIVRESEAVASADPLVKLVKTAVGHRARALLIGLGTGRTATELADSLGVVDVVEIEPQVIEFARAHFGYSGDAREADGAEVLRSSNAVYDAIILDAFDGTKPAAELVSRAGLGRAKERLLHDGVIAIRLLGRPSAAWIDEIRRSLAPLDVLVYGAGVGDETQNLYLLASRRRLAVDHYANRNIRLVYPSPGEEYGGLSLAGYLIREEHSGGLALDIAHDEMGAQRYLVVGPLAEALEAELPATAEFPVEGDYGPGPAIRKVPRDLAGGEGAMRSDLRFSPVVVAVRGRARLITAVHPDVAARGGRRGAGLAKAMGQTKDPRLPRGGVLYELTVEEVDGVYTRPAWERLKRSKLRPMLKRARAKIAAGNLPAVQSALGEYLSRFDAQFGDVAPLLAARAGVDDLHRILAARADGGLDTAVKRARACARLGDHAAGLRGDASALATPFFDCAIKQYEAALGDDPRVSPVVARALIELLDDRSDLTRDDARARHLRRKLHKLVKKTGIRVPR
ncbi:MAG: hypothetical protein AAF721_02320 [Myxococcota bacterium]